MVHTLRPRPRARTKRPQIAEAAWRLFTEHGYAGASMEAIAAAAEVSKATLYAYYPGKEALFGQVLAERGPAHATGLDTLDPTEPIAAALPRIAAALTRLILSDETVAAYRVIMSEGRNAPGLGARFYEAGPAVLLHTLATRLERAMRAGELCEAPGQRAASHLIGLILGELQLRLLLHVGDPPSPATRARAEADGIAAFLRAYAPSGRT